MFRNQWILKAIAAGCVFAAVPAAGQDRVQADVRVNRLSQILRTKVVIRDDKPAGEIVDVVYADGGCIDYFVASYDQQQYVIPFDAVQYRQADRIVFVDIAPAQFEQVQFFTGDRWPNLYAPDFRDQVFTRFNVRSGSARSRATLRPGAGVDIDVRGRDRDRDDRTDNQTSPKDNDRERMKDRDLPPAAGRENDRDRKPGDPANPAETRQEQRPREERAGGESRDRTPAPPRAGVDPERPKSEKPMTPERPRAAEPKPAPEAPPKRGSNDPSPLPKPPIVPKS